MTYETAKRICRFINCIGVFPHYRQRRDKTSDGRVTYVNEGQVWFVTPEGIRDILEGDAQGVLRETRSKLRRGVIHPMPASSEV